jgi:Orsellinic acid/F9775 biosynthesis cluster protein D
MNAYIHFNREHNVLICKVHQYAISSKFLARHFLRNHDLDVKIRQEIINYASQFTMAEPTQLLYSSEKVMPVPYLSIVSAFQCQYETCNKILGTLMSVKNHCRVDHDWKVKDGEKWVETRAQTFFQGHDKRYVN